MTYDHQPHVSRVVWKSFGAIADNHPEGMSRDRLVDAALMSWLLENHKDIIQHYLDMEDREDAFLESLKPGNGKSTDLQPPAILKESTP